LAIDLSGRPHISYQDGTTSDLKYAVGPQELTAADPGPLPRVANLAFYPNPCRGPLQIRGLANDSRPAAAVEIFTVGGKLIRRLNLDASGSGVWDVRDEQGRRVQAGMHFVRAIGPDGTLGPSRRVVILD